MPSATPKYAFPYPNLNEAPNGPAAFQALAEAVESTISGSSFKAGLAAAKPAHREGLAYYETDTDQLVVSDGAAWLTIWRKSDLTTTSHVRLRRTNAQTIPANNTTAISWDTNVESSGLYATSPPGLTANIAVPRTGLWDIRFKASHNQTSMMLAFINAGGEDNSVARGGGSSQPTVIMGSLVKKLDAAEIVSASIFTTSAGATGTSIYAPELTLRYLGPAV